MKYAQERYPDLAALQEARAAQFRADKKEEKRQQIAREKKEMHERREAAELQSYK